MAKSNKQILQRMVNEAMVDESIQFGMDVKRARTQTRSTKSKPKPPSSFINSIQGMKGKKGEPLFRTRRTA